MIVVVRQLRAAGWIRIEADTQLHDLLFQAIYYIENYWLSQ